LEPVVDISRGIDGVAGAAPGLHTARRRHTAGESDAQRTVNCANHAVLD
jgi:hypothetical protein